MKVLIISSNPRKDGNSDVLCDRFAEGALEAGYEVEKVTLRDKSIAGKKFYFIVTAADPQHEAAEGTLAAFRGFIRCLPDAQEKGIIYGMGTWDKGDVYRHPSYEQALVNLPESAKEVLEGLHGGSPASYAIRFAAGFEGIMMILSGMSDMEQMRDNISYMKDFQPLSDKELAAIKRVQEIFSSMNLISCTSCRYCVDGCTKKIANVC